MPLTCRVGNGDKFASLSRWLNFTLGYVFTKRYS
jgi:hypothetical protein